MKSCLKCLKLEAPEMAKKPLLSPAINTLRAEATFLRYHAGLYRENVASARRVAN